MQFIEINMTILT